jgi:hypothetical protein
MVVSKVMRLRRAARFCEIVTIALAAGTMLDFVGSVVFACLIEGFGDVWVSWFLGSFVASGVCLILTLVFDKVSRVIEERADFFGMGVRGWLMHNGVSKMEIDEILKEMGDL